MHAALDSLLFGSLVRFLCSIRARNRALIGVQSVVFRELCFEPDFFDFHLVFASYYRPIRAFLLLRPLLALRFIAAAHTRAATAEFVRQANRLMIDPTTERNNSEKYSIKRSAEQK